MRMTAQWHVSHRHTKTRGRGIGSGSVRGARRDEVLGLVEVGNLLLRHWHHLENVLVRQLRAEDDASRSQHDAGLWCVVLAGRLHSLGVVKMQRLVWPTAERRQ